MERSIAEAVLCSLYQKILDEIIRNALVNVSNFAA